MFTDASENASNTEVSDVSEVANMSDFSCVRFRQSWKKHESCHGGNHVVFHVENYGAMDAFIEGTSTNAQIRQILLALRLARCVSRIAMTRYKLVP